jgi:hypothetical protein
VRALLATALLALLPFLTACASTSGPDRGELASVQDAESAVVLLRVVVTSNAGPIPPFDEALESQCIGIGVSEPGGGPVEAVGVESFSDEALDAGWVYLLLPPGKHTVAFNPPRMWDPRGDGDRWTDTTYWSFGVPEGAQVVYLGTIQLHCRAGPSDFGGPRIREIRAQKLHDQTDVATALAAQHLPDLPAPRHVAMKRDFARESNMLSISR